MKRFLIAIIAIMLMLSIVGCSAKETVEETPAEPQATVEAPEEVVEEDVHEVETINLETESGSVIFNGYEAGADGLVQDGTAAVFKFTFKNYTSKPSNAQNLFSFQFFQNGAELHRSSGVYSTGGAQYDLYTKMWDDIMKDAEIEFCDIVLIEDNSPITVMVTDANNDENYQMMEVDIAGGSAGAEGGEAGAEVANLWYFDYYTDNFNQPIQDEWYVANNTLFTGTFSNSATSNSVLTSNILVDYDNDISIFLYQYGNHTVKNSSSRYVDEYNISMRLADGTDHKLTGTMYCGDDRIFIDDKYVDVFMNALMGTGDIQLYIERADRPIENYLFTVSPANFSAMYSIISNADSVTPAE